METQTQTQTQTQIQLTKIGIQGLGLGVPPGIPDLIVGIPASKKRERPLPKAPGRDLPRAVDFYADYGGCGFWRMVWPGVLMNGYQKAMVNGLTSMVMDPRFFNGVQAVRLQRQATPTQLEFAKFLHHYSQEHKYRVIYEIDDIIFRDDIPDFNHCKVAFEDERILQSSLEMMRMANEISVTCQFMKDYYIDKTGNKNITVVPNYPPKFWMDGHYDPKKISKNYNKHKKRPRIAWIASGTHMDITNKVSQRDDSFHVVDEIIKSRKKFKWVFIGSFPLRCKPFIDAGEMEYIQWFPLMELYKAYTTTEINAVIAPLMDCTFNKAKSNIKYLESACCGIPGVFQNLVTYKDAPLKFNSGSDLVNQLEYLFKNESTYMKYSRSARNYAENNWLEDHLDEYTELYFTPYGSVERKALRKNNPITT